MEVTITIFTAACAILCTIVSLVMKNMGKRRFYELASKFEGPPNLPFIGNAHLFIGSTEDHLKRISEIANSYPAPSRIWLVHRLCILVTDPEQVKAVFTSPKTLEKGYMYEFLKVLAGTSLVSAPADKWRAQRKLIQPTFNAKVSNPFVEVFTSQSKILASKMERNLDGTEFETFDLIASALLDMLCETLMDVEIGAQKHASLPLVDAIQTLGTTMSQRIFSVWLYPDVIFNHSQIGRDQRKALKIVRDLTENVIQRRKLVLLERGDLPQSPEEEDDEFKTKTQGEVFINHLLMASRGTNTYSEEELRDEVAAMIIAGHDTTAMIFSFVMLMLACHPDVQEKVYEELFEIYGDDDERGVALEDLGRMNYLERSIKETMRLFPVFPALTRAVTDNLDIGSEVVIPILEIHRSEKFWPNPLKFDPDRFLPEEVAKRHPYTYLAFSGGPRNCIGLRHGMMAMKIMAATLLRRYILKKNNAPPVKDIRLKMEVMLKPVHPITIKIERRIRA